MNIPALYAAGMINSDEGLRRSVQKMLMFCFGAYLCLQKVRNLLLSEAFKYRYIQLSSSIQ